MVLAEQELNPAHLTLEYIPLGSAADIYFCDSDLGHCLLYTDEEIEYRRCKMTSSKLQNELAVQVTRIRMSTRK